MRERQKKALEPILRGHLQIVKGQREKAENIRLINPYLLPAHIHYVKQMEELFKGLVLLLFGILLHVSVYDFHEFPQFVPILKLDFIHILLHLLISFLRFDGISARAPQLVLFLPAFPAAINSPY